VAEISAKMLKKGSRKKVGQKTVRLNFTKSGRKGSEENFLNKFLI
jgi:hypothetical protein